MGSGGQKLRVCVPFATISGLKFVSVQLWIDRRAGTMETASSERDLRIAVRAGKNGYYSYQIFTVAGEPKTLLSSRRVRSYASPAEAAKAGLEAAAVLNCIGRDLI